MSDKRLHLAFISTSVCNRQLTYWTGWPVMLAVLTSLKNPGRYVVCPNGEPYNRLIMHSSSLTAIKKASPKAAKFN